MQHLAATQMVGRRALLGGADWRHGFDLAVTEINKSGGISGRPLSYRFEDSQSDPRQAVAIAQKFVADPAIVADLGDFSSAASMAASPIYQRNHLVQFGFTNSHLGTTRSDIRDGLAKVKDIPSVLFGSVQFDPGTSRVRHPASIDLVVRGGAFALWDGKPVIQG